MNLTGRQWEQFSGVLRSAFDYDRLERLLLFRQEKRVEDITLARNLEQVVFDVIERAEAEGWTDGLLVAARESAPGNAKLFAFSEEFGLASTAASTGSLEQTITESNSFLDVAEWRSNLGLLEPRVCRITMPVPGAQILGTGFLVAADLVITNYHVMEPVILGSQGKSTKAGYSVAPGEVEVQFDYKRLSAGTVVNPGVAYGLAGDWLVHASPVSDADRQGDLGRLPDKDELDFALVRLNASAGDQYVGGKGEPGSALRGWVDLPAAPPPLKAHSPVFILQHPNGLPLKLTLETDAVVEVNANGTRVLYRTNTEPGSSGSPCFNQNWELTALHHWGDPNFDGVSPPRFNRGIPIGAIRATLEAHGLADVLGRTQ